MRTIRLTIEYDGTAYVGWQIQANGMAVQQVVESALARVLGEPVRLISSGRTDAGVHARGMVAHFTTHRDLPMAAYRDGVNRFLPKDVAVRAAAEAETGFHARFSATGKWYRYSICQAPVRSPLAARISWHLRAALDQQAMLEAAAAFVGCHDFAAFRASGCDAVTTVRRIYAVELSRQEELLHIDVKGSGFLRHMVRIMVGTLVEIGQDRMNVADLRRLLAGGSREDAGKTAPPQGLCLMEVWY
jgi:tRNA pseudouridine38-40 synthase